MRAIYWLSGTNNYRVEPLPNTPLDVNNPAFDRATYLLVSARVSRSFPDVSELG